MERAPGAVARLSFALIAVLASAGAGAVVVLHRRYEARLERDAHATLAQVATLHAHRVDEWIAERRADVRAIQSNPFVADGVAKLAAGASADAGGRVSTWLRAMVENRRLLDARLLGLDGRTLAAWPAGAAALGDAERRDVETAVSSGTIAISDVEVASGGERVLHVVAALGPPGATAAALVVRADLRTAILPLIEAWPSESATAESMLVGVDGDDVVFLSRTRHASVERRPLAQAGLPAVQAALGAEGPIDGTDYRGVRVVAAARAVAGGRYHVVAKIDRAEVLAPARRHGAFVAASALALLSALAGVLYAWRRWERAESEREASALRYERDAVADRHRMLSRFSNDIVLFVAEDGRILDANDRAMAAYGYDRATLLSLGIANLRAPEARAQLGAQLHAVRTSGAIRFETVHARADGTTFPVEVSSRAVELNGRTVLVSLVRDATERREAEQRLRVSEESFRTTLASIGDGVVTTDDQGRVTGMNPVAAELMRCTVDAARGRPLDEVFRIVNEDTRAPAESPVGRVLREGVVVGLANHTALLRPDGTEIPIADSGAPIRGDDGRVRGVVLVFRDASEERRIQRALEQEAKVLHSVSDAVISLDADWTIRDWNPAAERVFQYARPEVLGRGPDFLGTEVDGATVAELRARLDATGEARAEVRQRRRDGERLWIELSASVLRDGSGKPEGYVVACRDVTDRKRAEDEARASETKFRTAFRQAALGILIVDAEGRILEANRAMCEQLGYAADELVGVRTVFELVHPEDRGRSRRMVAELASGAREGFRDERRYLRKDGSVAYANLRLNAVRDEDGTFRFVIGLIEDVTERRNLHAQLMAADRMASVGTLAAGVAHEINNPLAFVTANVTWAREELSRPDANLGEVRDALAEVADGAQRVRDIVRDLKTFSREDPAAPTVTDVAAAIQSAVSLTNTEVRHRATLQLEVEGAPRVVGSPHRISQVLLNLIVNAAHAIAPGHVSANRITVAARDRGDGTVVLEVRDTGSGISPDVLPRIFEPFFTTKAVGEGTGLGLAICHGIVASVGGRIEVESELGRGTTFRVHLRAAAGEPVAAGASSAPARRPAASRARVLVVDDEALVRSSLVRILGRDHTVEVARSGREALELLARERVDVVLCDLMMPEMTGMELHERLRELHPELGPRTVFLTGGTFAPEAEAFVRSTRNLVLAKPFDVDGVLAAISAVIAGGAAEA